MPYRDFVAKYYYEKLELNKVHSIHIESKIENILEDCSLINAAKENGISFSSNIEQMGFLEQKQEGSLVVNKYQDYIEVNEQKLKNITQLLAILLYN
ncbi:MAG: hypothetical protein A2Y24_04385 [Clostridiales bacterium GWE2_32_10]|nr:MAG: hypothetical protein A2Y24_04385 [Clostridiales bacterium GWE2_32_10]HBY21331.1 hypothetical protein [Clostridiales bacterium]